MQNKQSPVHKGQYRQTSTQLVASDAHGELLTLAKRSVTSLTWARYVSWTQSNLVSNVIITGFLILRQVHGTQLERRDRLLPHELVNVFGVHVRADFPDTCSSIQADIHKTCRRMKKAGVLRKYRIPLRSTDIPIYTETVLYLANVSISHASVRLLQIKPTRRKPFMYAVVLPQSDTDYHKLRIYRSVIA